MNLEERIRQLEEKIKELRPDLSFPSTATLEQRVRWMEIVVRELVDGFRSDLGKPKVAPDTVVANAKVLSTDDISGLLTTQGDLLIRGAEGLERLAAGQSGQFLKTQGSGANPVWSNVPAPSANAMLEEFRTSLAIWWFNNNWRPQGMINYSTSGSASLSWRTRDLTIETGTTQNSVAAATKQAYGIDGCSWDKKRRFSIRAGLTGTWSAGDVLNIFMGYALKSTSAGYRPNDPQTYRHVGFKLNGTNLYGTVADGSTESTLSLGAWSSGRLECVFTPGQECRFYVNGEDKGAITTNLPSGTLHADYFFDVSLMNAAAAHNSGVQIFEVRLYQEE